MAFQPPADLGGAPVLPDNRPVQRPAAPAVPEDRGLPLVGDPDRGDPVRADFSAAEGFGDDVQRGGPDLVRVMLDPAGPGVMLPELLVRLRGDAAGLGIEDRAGAGGPLVDRENVGGYFRASTRARPNSSAASGPEPVINGPSFSTGFPV